MNDLSRIIFCYFRSDGEHLTSTEVVKKGEQGVVYDISTSGSAVFGWQWVTHYCESGTASSHADQRQLFCSPCCFFAMFFLPNVWHSHTFFFPLTCIFHPVSFILILPCLLSFPLSSHPALFFNSPRHPFSSASFHVAASLTHSRSAH